MEILGYSFAIIIGLIIGLIGGGGSILCVPVFAYVFGFDVIASTTLSMFVVGVTSAIGSAGYFKARNLDLKTGLWFGIPSIVSVVFVRKILITALPDQLFILGNFIVTKQFLILVLFAVLMLFSSYKMIKGVTKDNPKPIKPRKEKLILIGLSVGFITGLIGAGGGFLIVPALVMILDFDIKKAIGTSLFIITLNSLIGFIASSGLARIDWNFITLFSALSILGLFLGLSVSKKINSNKFKPIFGYFVLVIGVFILIKEIFFQS